MEAFILTRPAESYAAEIVSYRSEFLVSGDSMGGCGDLRTLADPLQYIAASRQLEDPLTVPKSRVQATQFLYVRQADQRVVGMIQVRHCFTEYLEKFGGHIGYSVSPSERQKGYATAMLAAVLPYCKEIGLEKVLLTCDDGNIASERTILANGGVYESTVFEAEENVDVKRFWIKIV